MYRGPHHSIKIKQSVLSLFEEGLTATQVAKIINKRFRSEDVRNLSRCAALGIKWRAGKCKKNYRKYNYPVRRSSGYNKSLALNELQIWHFLYRKTEQDELNLSKERLQLALRG